jgi:hypothetical protein
MGSGESIQSDVRWARRKAVEIKIRSAAADARLGLASSPPRFLEICEKFLAVPEVVITAGPFNFLTSFHNLISVKFEGSGKRH